MAFRDRKKKQPVDAAGTSAPQRSPGGGGGGFRNRRKAVTEPAPAEPAINYRPEGALKPGGGPERGSYEDYEQQPEWKKPLIAADDIIRILADTATFGYADKLGGVGERFKTQQARERAGWAGTGAEIAGLVAAPSAAARYVSKAPGLVGAGSRALGFGTEGAAMGGLSAAGHDQDIGQGMAFGGGAGAAGGALGGWLNKIFGRSAAKATQEYPTNKSVIDAGDAAKGRGATGLKARARRVEEAARAQAGGKEGFANLAKGIENAGRKNTGHSYSELEAIRHAGRTDTTPVANAFSTMGEAMKLKGVPWFVKHVTGLPIVGAGVKAGADLSKAFSNRREAEDVMALLRDPKGNGLNLSPEVVNMLRDKLSRTLIGGSLSEGPE